MPRITRYFPVSHDINSDHEVWEMRDTIGEKSLSIWLELLSIADRNNGELPVYCQSFSKRLAFKCRTTTKLTAMVWQWSIDHSWIVCDPIPRLRSYAKFHKKREPSLPQDGALLPKQPSETSETNILKNANTPSVDFKKEEPKKKALDPKVKEVADRIYTGDPERFRRLIAWIKDKEKRDYPPEVVAETLAQFEARDKTGKVKDWWPYLDRIHTKLYGQWNEVQAAKAKGEESKFILNLVKAVGK